MARLESYFQAPPGLSRMARPADEIETVAACVPIRRSNSASVILGLVKASGSRDLESPRVELHYSLITPLPGLPRDVCVSRQPWTDFRSGYLIWLAVLSSV